MGATGLSPALLHRPCTRHKVAPTRVPGSPGSGHPAGALTQAGVILSDRNQEM